MPFKCSCGFETMYEDEFRDHEEAKTEMCGI